MRFESTRGKSANADFETVLLSALADDGGLFQPTDLPRLNPEEIRDLILNRIPAGDRASAA